MPGGNIFHGDLSWPFAEDDADAGAWGVATDLRTCCSAARARAAAAGSAGSAATTRRWRCSRRRRRETVAARTGSTPRGRSPTPLPRRPGARRASSSARLVRHGRRGAARPRRPAHDAPDAHRGAGRALCEADAREPRLPARTSSCRRACGSSPRAPASRSTTSSSSAVPSRGLDEVMAALPSRGLEPARRRSSRSPRASSRPTDRRPSWHAARGSLRAAPHRRRRRPRPRARDGQRRAPGSSRRPRARSSPTRSR